MLPAGTVTFLFSDIEGSTTVLRAIGIERYESALQQHRRLLRDAFARNAGHEVGTGGDSFFVAFGRAVDAVRAAAEAHRELARHSWTDGERIRVRIGIHTCEATVSGANYVGIGVHRAARVSAAAHGDQIVLSHTTHDLLEDDPEVTCVDLGEHRLKDFAQPQRLYSWSASLPREFPRCTRRRSAGPVTTAPRAALRSRGSSTPFAPWCNGATPPLR
jgi:class 3 adenylate cyclase